MGVNCGKPTIDTIEIYCIDQTNRSMCLLYFFFFAKIRTLYLLDPSTQRTLNRIISNKIKLYLLSLNQIRRWVTSDKLSEGLGRWQGIWDKGLVGIDMIQGILLQQLLEDSNYGALALPGLPSEQNWLEELSVNVLISETKHHLFNLNTIVGTLCTIRYLQNKVHFLRSKQTIANIYLFVSVWYFENRNCSNKIIFSCKMYNLCHYSLGYF